MTEMQDRKPTGQLIGEPVKPGKQEVAEKQPQETDVAQEQVTAAFWGLVTATAL